MKRLFTFIILIILTFFINCVAFSEALAAEDTWYSQAAERAGNQVLLEDDQYYKGVSTDSRLISDLTYMEIPFQEYIDGTAADKIQIITFAEAFDKNNDGNIESKIVMYAYFPNSIGLEITRMWVFLDFESQTSLIDKEFVDILSEEDKNRYYDSSWTVAEQYDNIVKFYNGEVGPSFSKRPVENWFIKDSNNTTEVHTIFNATIDAYEYYSPVMEKKYIIENDGDGGFYTTQNFQFIRNIVDETDRETACVGFNYDTVSVVGETRKYRYKTDILLNEHKFMSHAHDIEYTDLFYFYFNVYDNDSGDKWKDKVISKVTLNYVTVKIEEYHTTYQYWGSTAAVRDWTVKAEILGANGNVILSKEMKPATTADFSTTAIKNFISENVYNVKEYSTCVVTPELLKINYLNDSINNSWEGFFSPDYATLDVEYLTLFSTSSSEFIKLMDDSISGNETELFQEYQYGLIFGDSRGYIYNNSSREWAEIYGPVAESSETYFHNELIGLVEIETIENGKTYKYTVTDTEVKNPGLIAPSSPGDDPWQESPGAPKPKDEDGFWAWIRKIIEFFTVTLPQWWEDNYVIIIGVIVVIVAIIATIFLVKLFRNWRTERMLNKIAQNQVQNNNQQQKPKRKTSKKKE